MTIEEETLSRSGVETLPDESGSPTSLTGKPARTQPRSWGDYMAGVGVTLLALALGVGLGYLARPALEPVAGEANVLSSPAEGPVAVRAPAANNRTGEEVMTVVEAPASADPPAESPATLLDIVQTGGHSKGAPEAPVVMVEYSDFQCPFCGRYAREVAGRIEEAYAGSGQVRLVYKHYTILGPASVLAALASECAAEQGKFWEYHDLLFARQSSGFTPDNLKSFATELGLDTAAFGQCLDAQKYLEVVQADTTEAQQLGIRGTPGFFINDTRVFGAQPFEAFQQVIEEQLQASN